MLGNRCNSYDNLPHDNESEEDMGLLHIPALVSPPSAEDVDLSPPDMGVASLDFDPMSFQCSPPKAEAEGPESGAAFLDSPTGYPKDKPSANKRDSEAGGSQAQTPGSTASSEPMSPLRETPSPFFTLDLSPSEEKSSKPSSFTEKVVYAFSPKIGRKLGKSPSMNISEPISVTLPPRVSEVISAASAAASATASATASTTAAQTRSPPTWHTGVDESAVGTRSPPQVGKMKANEREALEGCEPGVQPPVLAVAVAAAAEVEAPGREEEEPCVSDGQSKAVPSGQAQTGTVCFPPLFL